MGVNIEKLNMNIPQVPSTACEVTVNVSASPPMHAGITILLKDK